MGSNQKVVMQVVYCFIFICITPLHMKLRLCGVYLLIYGGNIMCITLVDTLFTLKNFQYLFLPLDFGTRWRRLNETNFKPSHCVVWSDHFQILFWFMWYPHLPIDWCCLIQQIQQSITDILWFEVSRCGLQLILNCKSSKLPPPIGPTWSMGKGWCHTGNCLSEVSLKILTNTDLILLLLVSQQKRREFCASLRHMFISCIVKVLHDPNKIPISLAKSA
jgi:hypothetical protein